MQTFNFYKDEKNTIWTRLEFSVQAESYEKAIKMVKETEENKGTYFGNEISSEILTETLEFMLPEENEGQATCEIYSEDTNNLIYTNEIKPN